MKKLFLGLLVMAVLLVTAYSAFALDYWHGNTCGRPDGIDATPRFVGKGLLPKTVERGSLTLFDVDVTGKETGYAVCELGIYYEDVVKSWYGGSLSIGAWDSLTGNCVEGENFVITKRFYVQQGQTQRVTYSVYIPYDYSLDKPVVAHVNCFNHCYNCDFQNYEQFGRDSWALNLKGIVELPESHCDNWYIDRDESDLDCGGEDCEPCATGHKCREDSDCAGNSCYQNICQDKPATGTGGTGSSGSDTGGSGTGETGDSNYLLVIIFGAILFGAMGLIYFGGYGVPIGMIVGVGVALIINAVV